MPLRAADSGIGVARLDKLSVRTGHCATMHQGRLLVFGGLNDKNVLLDDLMTVTLIA